MRNVTISARNSQNQLTGQIHLGNQEVIMKSKRLRVLDENNRNLLYADKDKLEINVKGVEFVGKKLNFYFQFLIFFALHNIHMLFTTCMTFIKVSIVKCDGKTWMSLVIVEDWAQVGRGAFSLTEVHFIHAIL